MKIPRKCHNHEHGNATTTSKEMPQLRTRTCHNHKQGNATITNKEMPQSRKCHNYEQGNATITNKEMPQLRTRTCHNHKQGNATITNKEMPQSRTRKCHNYETVFLGTKRRRDEEQAITKQTSHMKPPTHKKELYQNQRSQFRPVREKKTNRGLNHFLFFFIFTLNSDAALSETCLFTSLTY